MSHDKASHRPYVPRTGDPQTKYGPGTYFLGPKYCLKLFWSGKQHLKIRRFYRNIQISKLSRKKIGRPGNIKKVEIFHKKSGRQRSTKSYPLTVFFVYWNNCTGLSGKNWTHFRKKVWEYQNEIQTFVEFLDLKNRILNKIRILSCKAGYSYAIREH